MQLRKPSTIKKALYELTLSFKKADYKMIMIKEHVAAYEKKKPYSWVAFSPKIFFRMLGASTKWPPSQNMNAQTQTR